jgi:hypothetical protein
MKNCSTKAVRAWLLAAGVSSLLAFGAGRAQASIAYGTINNFDTVNDTGVTCHGFEIEIEDIHSTDITYTYDWNHYGTPKITEDNSNPLHPVVRICYQSARTNGVWASYTAVPSSPINPTDGHQFTNPSINFGGEHFGVGYYGNPTNIHYFWLIDDGAGNLVRGPAVNIATPTFVYYPPVNNQPAQVVAEIKAPERAENEPIREFGPAVWVKSIVTTSHNNNQIKLRDLVSEDPDHPEREDWRNGEPDEVEIEWELMQTDFNRNDGGKNGKLEGNAEEMPDGDEVITRRYEFFEYVGPLDPENGEALADTVGVDELHGIDEYAETVVVGNYLGAQMSAFDADEGVGIIDHVSEATMDEPYATRRLVIAGTQPFTCTKTGALPAGMAFDEITGELSGTPTEAGVFDFTVEATPLAGAPLARAFSLTVAEPAAVLPPRSTVDTAALPAAAGNTTGNGTFTNDALVTVTATANPGFAFVNWTDNGTPVSSSPTFEFPASINRSLVANFRPAAELKLVPNAAGGLRIHWPMNATNVVLQECGDPGLGVWTACTNAVSTVGDQREVTVPIGIGAHFFRLVTP